MTQILKGLTIHFCSKSAIEGTSQIILVNLYYRNQALMICDCFYVVRMLKFYLKYGKDVHKTEVSLKGSDWCCSASTIWPRTTIFTSSSTKSWSICSESFRYVLSELCGFQKTNTYCFLNSYLIDFKK